MTVIKSITSFPSLSLPTPDLYWTPEQSWSHERLQEYIDFRHKHQESIAKAPPFKHSPGDLGGLRLCRYLLSKNGEPAQGWCELQSFSRKFDRALIFGGSTMPLETASWAVLITAGFAISKADTLRLVNLSRQELGDFEGLGTALRIAMVTNGHIELVDSIEFGRANWLESDLALSCPGIRSLEARRKRLDSTKKTSSQKKRGLLSRLFNPRLDDAIF
ncbi:hypothetical protein [Pseudobacteriovorax antillogorgiicola]|uniref:Uncharacterized protein n=1 Tax=Pseudobacteriovorax antillogorgiicola TaxID=1513793 RepID=A0A1Y6B3J1_9BACT|nr:hypothetical protein [Pseudobacteriovorax antillogorgiicola]TCS59454.1 hypothetical protein EDD56_101366 [Pseudobacteriovorax antillogorgiicola]SME88198.1 hypothetical protein SAMN06296036_101119 [Pseudobacteriovorax antillogorgiicola]